MKSISAQCGHVKHCLSKNEPLSEKVLKFTLNVIDENIKGNSDDELLLKIANKLSTGKTLDDYEYHIMVDVLLVYKKLQHAG